MKRFAGIFLLVAYIIAYTEGHQVLRIPFLLKHFSIHNQADPSMSFARFLRIHYIEPTAEADDFLEDQQLPFRNIDFSLLQVSLFEMDQPALEIAPPPMTSQLFYTYNETNKPLFPAFDIFQPPRYAA